MCWEDLSVERNDIRENGINSLTYGELNKCFFFFSCAPLTINCDVKFADAAELVA